MKRIARSEARALVAALVVVLVTACGGGGGGGGDGSKDVQALNFNEANLTYASGVAARVFDLFRPVTDLLEASFDLLWTPGAVQPGQPVALAGRCTLGAATLTWTDADPGGAPSAGDRLAIELAACGVHPDDAESIGGTLSLTISTLAGGSPRTISGPLQLDLTLAGQATGKLQGTILLSASSGTAGLELEFHPSGTSLLAQTGSPAFDLACFDAVDYPAAGFARQVAVMGAVRTLGKVMSISPGSKLYYREDDVPGAGSVDLLSFLADPSCPALGIAGGAANSDGSTASFYPGASQGEMRLELHRPGVDTYSTTTDWHDLLHP